MGVCRNLKAATVHAWFSQPGHEISLGVLIHAGLVSSEGCGRKSCQVVLEDRVCSKREPGRDEWLLVYFLFALEVIFLASVCMHFPLNRS